MERWLRYWLSTRVSIRATTRLHYTRDVEKFLIPHLGKITLAELTTRRLAAGFARIASTSNRYGQPQSASTMQHLRTTLRAALNLAVREGIIVDNSARRIEVRSYRQPRAQVWTEGRVAEWGSTGVRPPVGVWTPEHLATFLDAVAEDRLFALWRLIGLRGLRRGEAAGLRWSEVDLDRGHVFVVLNRTTAGYDVVEGPPKSPSGNRAVALDRQTAEALREHRRRQLAQGARRVAAGKRWRDSGYVFTRRDGDPVHPGYLTQRFATLVKRAGLPPIRLHDLRHGAASPAHQAGADLKTLQEQLGHASIVITADVYTSVLPVAQRKSAEATARLVLKAARKNRQKIKRKGRRNRPSVPQKTGAPAPSAPKTPTDSQVTRRTTDTVSPTVTAQARPHRDPHRPQRS